MDAKTVLHAAKEYLKEHPEEVPRILRGMMRMRLGIPLAVPRFLARNFVSGQGHKKDVIISAVPPGLKLTTTLDANGAMVHASMIVVLEQLRINTEEVRLGFRISEMKAQVMEGDSEIAAKIRSGEYDFSRPASLLRFLPERPPALVEAEDDWVCFDLMKIPEFAQNPGIRRMLRLVNPVVGLRSIRTDDDHLDIYFRASPLVGVATSLKNLFS